MTLIVYDCKAELREVILTRDRGCVITGALPTRCHAAHLAPRLRFDVECHDTVSARARERILNHFLLFIQLYKELLGEEYAGEFDESYAIVLERSWHAAYDKFEWSLYEKVRKCSKIHIQMLAE